MAEQLPLEGGGGLPARPSILTLDLSLTATGWCLNGESGVITSRQRGWDRVAALTQEIFRMTFGVDLVVIEGYAYGAKGQSVYQIAELGGIVRFWLYAHHLTTVEINPSTLKKFATGKGNAGKDQMIAAAIRRFYFRGTDNNEADAYLLWCMAREAYGGPVAKLPAQLAAVVHCLSWPRGIFRGEAAQGEAVA
jgi:crossover junction endodeoxyribonuclease RuvC